MQHKWMMGWVLLMLITTSLRAQDARLAEGDIIFQSNISPQCRAIELATHSRYSHCGILFKKDGKWFVFERYSLLRRRPMRTGSPATGSTMP